MTSGLQRNIRRTSIVTSVLGCSDAEWREHLGRVEDTGGTVLDALTSFYFLRLESIYGRAPLAVLIPGKDGNPVSVVFLAVEHDAAWYSLRRESLPHFETWLSQKYEPRKEWVRAWHRIDRELPPNQRQTELGEFG